MVKRIIALALSSLLVLFTAAGCAKPSTSSKTSSVANSGVVNVLTEWAFTDDVLKAFQDKTGIEVVQNVVLNPSNLQSLRDAKMAAGENLDILDINPGVTNLMDFVKKGYLLDLSKQSWLSNFNPDMLTTMQNTVTNTPGKTYAVSYEAIYSGVWYNKNIFQQYNLSVPKDWDDFLNICKSLKSNGVTPLVQGGKDLWPIDEDKSLPLYALYDSNKEFKADLYSGTVKWTDPDVGAQFARLGQLLDPKNGYYVSGMLGTTYAQCYQLMLQHKAAMWIMGSWATETMTQSSVKPDFEMGFFPLPNNDAGQTQHSYGQLAARPYGIYAKSKNVNNALSFLEFMSEPANMSIQAKETEVIPTVKDATAVSVPAWSDLQNLMKLPLGGEANQDMSSGHAIGANVQQIWWSELDKVAAGSETMDQYLQALQAAQTKDSATK